MLEMGSHDHYTLEKTYLTFFEYPDIFFYAQYTVQLITKQLEDQAFSYYSQPPVPRHMSYRKNSMCSIKQCSHWFSCTDWTLTLPYLGYSIKKYKISIGKFKKTAWRSNLKRFRGSRERVGMKLGEKVGGGFREKVWLKLGKKVWSLRGVKSGNNGRGWNRIKRFNGVKSDQNIRSLYYIVATPPAPTLTCKTIGVLEKSLSWCLY